MRETIVHSLLIQLHQLEIEETNAFRKMVGVLLEANGRGYWETTPGQVEKLQELYQDLEDRIEGIDEPVAAKGFGF